MSSAEYYLFDEDGKIFAGCPKWRDSYPPLPWLNPRNRHTRIDVMATDAFDDQKQLICKIVVGLECACGANCKILEGAEIPSIAERTTEPG
jgi:hypothetical protein